MTISVLIPDDALVVDIAEIAAQNSLFLIRHQKTGRHALSPTVPAGWNRCGAAHRNLEPSPEAA